MPTEHSTLVGGSTAPRAINCPGSIILTRDIPSKTSPAAVRGTMLHSAMEAVVYAYLSGGEPIEDLMYERYEGELVGPELWREKIVPAYEALKVLLPVPGVDTVYVERKVALIEVDGAFGTLDLAWRIDDELHVLDWKFGDGVMVPAEENLSLGFYAAGLLDSIDGWQEAGEIVFHIVQPARGATDFDEIVSTWETDVDWVSSVYDRVRRAVELAHTPGEPILSPGSHCRFCPASAVCPRQNADLRALATTVGALPSISAVKNAQLSEMLRVADQVADFARALQAEAYSRIEAGQDVPGWKLVRKRATRQWTLSEGELVAKYGPQVYEAPKVKSPAALEKMIGKSKVEADDVATIAGGLTLAKSDDPRRQVTFTDVSSTIKGALS